MSSRVGTFSTFGQHHLSDMTITFSAKDNENMQISKTYELARMFQTNGKYIEAPTEAWRVQIEYLSGLRAHTSCPGQRTAPKPIYG